MVVKTGTSAEDEQATWVRFRVAMNRIGWEMVRGRQRVSDLWWMITGSHHCLLPYDCNSILTIWLSSFASGKSPSCKVTKVHQAVRESRMKAIEQEISC